MSTRKGGHPLRNALTVCAIALLLSLACSVALAETAKQKSTGWHWEGDRWVYDRADKAPPAEPNASKGESEKATADKPQGEKTPEAAPSQPASPPPAAPEPPKTVPLPPPALESPPAAPEKTKVMPPKEAPAATGRASTTPPAAPEKGEAKPPEPKPAAPASSQKTTLAAAAKGKAPQPTVLASTQKAAPATSAGDTKPAAPKPLQNVPAQPSVPLKVSNISFPVTKLVLSYGPGMDTRGLPKIEEIAALEVMLGKDGAAYVGVSGAKSIVRERLDRIGGTEPVSLHAQAIVDVLEQIVRYLNSRHIYGTYVLPDDRDIEQRVKKDEMGRDKEAELKDLRLVSQRELRLVIWVGRVTKIETQAIGDRVSSENRLNNPAHAFILKESPVKPLTDKDRNLTLNLIDRDALENYVAWLNRHPSRRVDVAVAGQSGNLELHYLVTENKPWYVYQQTSNTGTEATGEWHYRFGFITNQLTGNDDILALDYVTSKDQRAEAAMITYEAPFLFLRRLRWAVHAGWSHYSAQDLGVAQVDFTGRSSQVGGDLILNFFQYKRLFVDVLAGVRLEHISVNNLTAKIMGETDLFIPTVGLRAEHITEGSSLVAEGRVEWLSPGTAHTRPQDLVALGRRDPDSEWTLFKWAVWHAFFLEPLLTPDWEKALETQKATLAHEVVASFRGQNSLGSRLIPQQEQVIGGLYTVRGYPESVAAGDSTYVASAEYKFHIPKVFRVTEDPPRVFGSRFRFAPQEVAGQPDWDWVLRAFFDVGKTNIAKARTFEFNRLLMGTGVGMDIIVKRNLSIRLDYGFALRGVDMTPAVEAGDQRLHVSVTLLY